MPVNPAPRQYLRGGVVPPRKYPLSMLRALIFDFDGLMVDTESPALHAWQEVYRRHGQELPIDVWAQVIGTNEHRFDAMEHLEGLHGAPLDRESLYAVRDQLKTELTDAQQLLPGLRALVEHAHATGIKLAEYLKEVETIDGDDLDKILRGEEVIPSGPSITEQARTREAKVAKDAKEAERKAKEGARPFRPEPSPS